MITSTILEGGETTLPREIQDILQAKPGRELVYEISGDSVVIKVQEVSSAKHTALKDAVKAGFDQLDRGEIYPHPVREIADRVLARKLDQTS